MTEAQTAPRSKHKQFTGVVTSNKMVKTIVVQVTRKVRHPIYHRVVTRSKKFKVHDEKNSAKQGDTVRFVETRPLSKDKRWRLLEILKRGVETIEEKELS